MILQKLESSLVKLQQSHNELVGITNKNSEAFTRAVQHLELRINAVMLAVDAQQGGAGPVLSISDSGDKKVAWNQYLMTALENMKVAVAAMKEMPDLQSPHETMGAEQSEDDLIEFGGAANG